jgi:glycosyltransferase involved in cell wall biosynthesis
MRLIYLHTSHLDSKYANVVQVVNMCEAFSQCGADVTLAIASPQSKSAKSSTLLEELIGRPPNFNAILYKKQQIAKRFEILGNHFRIQSILKTSRADFCFVRNPLYLHLSVNACLPTIFESHNLCLHPRSKLMANIWERDVLNIVQKRSLLKFVSISQKLADAWNAKGVPEQKHLVLQDGFNKHFFEREKPRAEARGITGLPQNKKIIVYSGRVSIDRKDEWLIQLASEFADVYFVIVGGYGKRKDYLENKTRELRISNMFWAGQVPHSAIADYLFSADILLMMWSWEVPTIQYFSSLKMFEYMASGRIIVGQRFPTVEEVLVDGKTAYLAEPNSYDDLKNKLVHALRKEYPSDMATQARRLALEKYSWHFRAQKILDSVDGLI